MKNYEALSKKHFDGQAAEYDQRDTYYYSRNGKISCRDIAGQIKNLTYESLLDVGCGTGFLLELLIKQRPARYYGADLSDEMIRVAKEKQIDGAEFVVSSADKLPYPDETFHRKSRGGAHIADLSVFPLGDGHLDLCAVIGNPKRLHRGGAV